MKTQQQLETIKHFISFADAQTQTKFPLPNGGGHFFMRTDPNENEKQKGTSYCLRIERDTDKKDTDFPFAYGEQTAWACGDKEVFKPWSVCYVSNDSEACFSVQLNKDRTELLGFNVELPA